MSGTHHRCTEPGCGFNLPESYSLPKCPWHLAPGRTGKQRILAVAGAAAALGVGMGIQKVRTLRARRAEEAARREQQAEWRARKSERAEADETIQRVDDVSAPPREKVGT